MTIFGNRTPPDRLRIMQVLDKGVPKTTLELATMLGLDLGRVASAVALMLAEHIVDCGPRRPDGFAWLLNDEIGVREFDRAEASFTGQPIRQRDDDGAIDANMRRIGG